MVILEQMIPENHLLHLPEYTELDDGYHNARVSHQLAAQNIHGVIGYRRHTHNGEHFRKYCITYDREQTYASVRRSIF